MYLVRRLEHLGERVAAYLRACQPWTNVYGLARSLLALGTFLTLVFNPTDNLFRPLAGAIEPVNCAGPASISLFCLVPFSQLELARYLGMAILLIVMTGWQPRWTALPHWWVAFSLQSSARVVDGGDQVSNVLTLLLLPIALTDPRPWHWQKVTPPKTPSLTALLVAQSALVAIRLQIAAIYFHAVVAKWKVEEWTDGTALYYWLNSPYTGAPGYLRPLLEPFLSSGFVALLTWSVLVLEVALAAGLVVAKPYWHPLFVAGLLFHLGIAVFLGIPSFAIAMMAALTLYLRPTEKVFYLNVKVKPKATHLETG